MLRHFLTDPKSHIDLADEVTCVLKTFFYWQCSSLEDMKVAKLHIVLVMRGLAEDNFCDINGKLGEYLYDNVRIIALHIVLNSCF